MPDTISQPPQAELDRETVRNIAWVFLFLVALSGFLVFASSLVHLYQLGNEKIDGVTGHVVKAVGGAVASGTTGFFGQLEAAIPLGIASFGEVVNAFSASDAQEKHDHLVAAWESKAFWSAVSLVLAGTGLSCFAKIEWLINRSVDWLNPVEW